MTNNRSPPWLMSVLPTKNLEGRWNPDFRSTCQWFVAHVGNNICENYPRRIGQGLNDASCILCGMISSFVGLPNPAWVILANVVSHMVNRSPNRVLKTLKSASKIRIHLYAPQTTVLEGWTKLTKDYPSQTKMSVENSDFIFCSSFRNLRLGSIKMKFGFLCSPNEDFGRRNKRWNPD